MKYIGVLTQEMVDAALPQPNDGDSEDVRVIYEELNNQFSEQFAEVSADETNHLTVDCSRPEDYDGFAIVRRWIDELESSLIGQYFYQKGKLRAYNFTDDGHLTWVINFVAEE